MAMTTKVIVSKTFSISPNTETYQTLYTVSPGLKLRLKKIKVHFPTGVASQLHVKIYHGWMSVAPKEGFFTGDNVLLEYDLDVEYGSEAHVRVYFKNTSGASTKECVISMEGEEQ